VTGAGAERDARVPGTRHGRPSVVGMTFPLLHHRTLALSGAAVAALTLTACGGNGLQSSASGTTSTSPSPEPSSALPSPTASTSASPAPVPPSGTALPSTPAVRTPSPEPVAVPICGQPDLKVSLQAQDAAMGSSYSLLTFRNTSRQTCTMDGHPGVSFVGKHDGTQIGQPAVRNGTLKKVTLAPGESTSALLQIANAGNYPASTCAPTTVDGLRVYPPDSRVSVFVALRTQACQGDTGASPQMSVSAVGHTG
jgi:hypothetical protein